MATALRRVGIEAGPEGTRLLREPRQQYADGAEQRVLEILQGAADVSSTSAELLPHATNWAERYHLTPQRGVILEFLDIPAGAKVLEIGAGCGPITRHLGERGAVVDAIEPMPARAAANRERCRDLDQVEVFVGELEDVPDEAVYDFVVIIGVLEYMGGGSADSTPYRTFLEGLQRRLVDGGQLVLAIENQLGIKYFAGAAEDHTNRIFDGIEGYPHQQFDGQPSHGPARTFNRRALSDLISSAGFRVDRVLTAFPDYKVTRTVMDASLDDLDPTLAYRIPRFPSPDQVQPRPRLLSEEAIWRSVVTAGLSADFGNSFLVVAAKGDPATPAWPDGRLAGFANLERRPGLMTRTVLQHDADGVARYHRRFVGSRADEDIHTHAGVSDHRPGQDLIEILARSDDAALTGLLQSWMKVLQEHPDDSYLDLIPSNIVVGEDGEFHPIDLEFTVDGWTRDQVVARGLFWTAYHLGRLQPAARWPDCRTVEDLYRRLRELVGLPEGDLDGLVEAEGRLQDGVNIVAGSGAEDVRALLASELLGRGPGLSLGPGPFDGGLMARLYGLEGENEVLKAEYLATRTSSGFPDDERPLHRVVAELAAERARWGTELVELNAVLDGLRAERDVLKAEYHATRAASGRPADKRPLHEVVAELDNADHRLQKLQSSRSFRVASRFDRLVSRALPIGTRREKLTARLLGERRS